MGWIYDTVVRFHGPIFGVIAAVGVGLFGFAVLPLLAVVVVVVVFVVVDMDRMDQ